MPILRPLVSACLSAGISSRASAACGQDGPQHFLCLIQVLLDHRNGCRSKASDYIVITVVCLSLKIPQILLVIFHHVLRIGLVKISAA